MTTEALAAPRGRGLLAGLAGSRTLPISVVVLTILLIWYGATVLLNAPQQIELHDLAGVPVGEKHVLVVAVQA